MRLLFFCVLLLGAAGCGKTSAPLKLYFIGSSRFVSGSRTANSADTLAARIYADDSLASPRGITNLRVTVDYAPRPLPFLYPTPITAYLPSLVQPSLVSVVYLDSTFAAPQPVELLYTTVFGVRTSVGTERWTFTVSDKASNTSSRTFTLNQRRSDSTTVYDDYTLKLNLLAGANVRRYIDLKSGLAVPGFTALNSANGTVLQPTIDAILLPSGGLASPDYFATSLPAGLSTTRWPTSRRSSTRFSLTSLNDTTFALQTDTLAFRTLFQRGTNTSLVNGLTTRRVYAFRAQGTPSRYGLLLVASTTSGLQLRVRVAKQPL